MAEGDKWEALYAAIAKRAPVAEVTSLIMDEHMLSARKWKVPGVIFPAYGSALHCASYYNHVDLVCELISRHAADLNQRTIKAIQWPALHVASWKGNTDVAHVLIRSGANVHTTNDSGDSALHFAGHADVARLLIAQGAKVNATNKAGAPALHDASKQGKTEVVHVLVEEGANVNAIDRNGMSALHLASINGSKETVRLLLDYGAHLNATDRTGMSALHYASRCGKKEAVCLLLDKGAHLNAADRNGNTPLHHAAKGSSSPFQSVRNHVPTTKVLLEAGADPTTQNSDGETPANIAPDEAVKQFLKEAEADHNLTHLEKETPKVVRMAVLGDEAVGKTQFIATVTSPVATAVSELPEPPAEGTEEYFAQRTSGVQLTDVVLKDDRIVRALDLGGQQQFTVSHRPIMFTGYGIYLLVLNLLAGLAGMVKSGKYWLHFVLATRHREMLRGRETPPLLVLFSHADRTDSISGENPQRLAGEVYACLRDEFDEHFQWMQEGPFISDCRLRSPDLNRLLVALDEAHTTVARAMPKEPLINNRIRQALQTRNQQTASSGGILHLEDYYDFLRKHVTGLAEKDLASLTTLLDMQADVMLFDSKEKGPQAADAYVVVDPHHVCHHVLRAILSPRSCPESCLWFPPHGVIAGAKLDKALAKAGADPKAGKGLLHFSQICSPNPQPPDSHFFAIHVQATSGTWEEDGLTKPHSGVQIHSMKVPFSQAFMPALQIELSKRSGGINERSLIWKTGLVVNWEHKVKLMVQQVEDGFGVNILARAHPGNVKACAVALADASTITMKTSESVSPGTDAELLYLSPSQISKGDKPTVTYKGEHVIMHFQQRELLLHGQVTDDPDEVMEVVRATQPGLCVELGVSPEAAAKLHDHSGMRGHALGHHSQQRSSHTDQSDGVQLTSDSAVLHEISQYFSEASVHSLAAILLENKCAGGGLGFIEQHSSAFARPNWSLMAHKVLTEWCVQTPSVFGHNLLPVLEKVLPAVAKDFRGKLLGTAA